jgi:hypothetical protein
MSFLETVYFGNSVKTWAIALGVTLLAFLVLRLVAVTLVGRVARLASNTRTEWDDIVTSALQKTRAPTLLVFALFLGAIPLTLPNGLEAFLKSAAAIALFIQVGLWVSSGISGWMDRYREKRTESDVSAVMSMNVLVIFARLVLWSLVVLLALDNVGVDVTAPCGRPWNRGCGRSPGSPKHPWGSIRLCVHRHRQALRPG